MNTDLGFTFPQTQKYFTHCPDCKERTYNFIAEGDVSVRFAPADDFYLEDVITDVTEQCVMNEIVLGKA